MALDAIEAALTQQPVPGADPIESALSAKPPAKAVTAEKPSGNPLLDPLFYRDMANNALDMGLAFTHHAMNLPHGAAQLVEHGIASAANTLPSNPVSSYINKVVSQDDAAMAAREASYQASVPNSAASYTGAAAGEIAPFLLGGELQKGMQFLSEAGARPFTSLASRFPQVGGLLGATGRAVGGSLQGAAISAAAPVTSGDYGTEKAKQVKIGAIAGAAVPAAIDIGKVIGRSVKGLAAPFTNPESIAATAAQNLAGGNQAQMAQRLQQAPEYVPGSIPTAAQAAPTPEMIQAEKTLANNPDLKPLFVQREIANNQARLAAVESIAGPPGALQQAKAERDRIAQNLYGYAFDHPGEVTPWVKGQITQLAKRPAMQEAMKDARRLALNEGIKLNDSTSIQGLHYAKLSLDDQISRAISNGNGNDARTLIGTRDKLLTLMEKLSPTYAQARQEFAAASRPINTMELANELLDKLKTNAFDASGMPKIDYRGYKTALSRALSNSEYRIDPQAQSVLENVQKDLQRATASNAVRTAGSDTAFNLQAPGWLARHVYGNNFTGPTMTGKIIGGLAGGGFTGHPILGAAAGYTAAEKLGNLAAKRVGKEVASTMLDPAKFAGLLAAANAGNPVARNAVAGLLAERAPQALAYSYARQSVRAP